MFHRAARHLFIIALFATSHAARAQYFIDLSKEKLDIPDCGVQVDSVVVAFDDHAPIGERGKKHEPVLFAGSSGSRLNELLQRSLPSAPVRRHVLLKVNALKVEERQVKGGALGICSINVEFITHIGGRLVREYFHGATVWNSAVEASESHAPNIAAALEQCINGYASAVNERRTTETPLSIADLRRPSDPRTLEMPVLQRDNVARGVYWSFMDLVDAHPDTTRKFTIKDISEKKTGDEVKVKSDAGSDLSGAWGVCDGKDPYINVGDRFVRLRRNGDRFQLTATLGKDAFKVGDVAAGVGGAILFGIMGAVVVGIMTEAPDAAPSKYDVDLLTGMLMPSIDATNTRTDARNESIFLYSDLSTRDTTVCLYMYGGLEACLHRGQYHTVHLVPRKDPVPIETRAGEVHVEVQVDASMPTSQVFSIHFNNDSVLVVEPLRAAAAVTIRDSLQSQNEVK